MKNLIVIIVLMSLIGCASSNLQITYRTVENSRIKKIEDIVISKNLEAAEEKIADLLQFYPDDPVLLTVAGNLALQKGDYTFAVEYFLEVKELILSRKLLTSQKMVPQFAPVQKNLVDDNVSANETAKLFTICKNFLNERSSHDDLMLELKKYPGFLIYPPTFHGTVGLVIEVINKQTQYEFFKLRNMPYFNPASDTSFEISNILTTTGINLITSGMLARDLSAISDGIGILKSVPKPNKESRFFTGFGMWLIGEIGYQKFFASKITQLFQ